MLSIAQRNSWRVKRKAAPFCLLALLALGACQSELYHAVPEREANMMVSILQHHSIEAYKQDSETKGSYSIYVESNEFSRAVEVLSVQGYPRRMHENLGKLFEPSGLVPTQFEEQVRYIYGLSEELSHTISLFDGVVENRVHIALPDTNEKEERGRVSVYIKYDQNVDFDSLVPQVKKMISDSIGHVGYKNVEVLAVPTYLHKNEAPTLVAHKFPAGIRVLPEYYNFFIAFSIAIFLIILQLAGASFWFFKQWQKENEKNTLQADKEQKRIEGQATQPDTQSGVSQ